MALRLSELEVNLIHVTGTGLAGRLKIEDVPWFAAQQTRVEEQPVGIWPFGPLCQWKANHENIGGR